MIALVGNPNTGKSTLFNALGTGRTAKVSNLTGTTVSVLRGTLTVGERKVDLLDIPGTYSLAGQSPDEWVAVRAVLGVGSERPDLVVFLADAVRLERSLYLALQLLELQVPMVVAVNLLDEARRQGLDVDLEALQRDLGVPVVGISARNREGLDVLKSRIALALQAPPDAAPVHGWSPELTEALARVEAHLPEHLARPGMASVVALSLDGDATPDPALQVESLKADLAGLPSAVTELVQTRYRWLDARAPSWRGRTIEVERTVSDRIDAVVLHPVAGTVLFLGVMLLVFTMLFSWADPFIGAIEGVFGSLGGAVSGLFGATPGPMATVLRDFLVQGIVGGVGSVLVFVPQIGLLFFFLALLEDSGYLARAAHLADRVLRAAGLPGRAFVPLLSGYACAVPAIMATRTLPRFRDRLLTMMVIPLTSCSARLPVYSLVIAAVFPATLAGVPFGVRPLALLGMYAFSTLMAVLASVVLGRLVLPADRGTSLIELVPYRVPSPRVVLESTWRNVKDFVQEAGGVILLATVVLWAMLYFPRVDGAALMTPDVRAEAVASGRDLAEVQKSLELERSFAGRVGHAIEPAIRPLGFDWKTGVGIIGAFAAREVFVSTL
ncbi:MAG: ferrous iron transport protein B, partial [Myxococcales bacterium]|nr:ferrous iron transport protein B [Myxococcales bacterium]